MFCIHYINMWYLSILSNSIHYIGTLEDYSLRPSSICSCGSARSIPNAQLFLYVIFFFRSIFLGLRNCIDVCDCVPYRIHSMLGAAVFS